MKLLILASILFSGFASAQVKVTEPIALPDYCHSTVKADIAKCNAWLNSQAKASEACSSGKSEDKEICEKLKQSEAFAQNQGNIEKGIKQDLEDDLKLAGCSMPSDESVIDCGDKVYLPTSTIKVKTHNDDLPDYCHSKKPEMKKICKMYKDADPSWRDASIAGAELLAGLERQADEIMLSGCAMAGDDKSITCGKRVYRLSEAVSNSSRNEIKSDSMASPLKRVDREVGSSANKK